MKCINCQIVFSPEKHIHTPYSHFFYNTCKDCMQTCASCGFESGYHKPNDLLSTNVCDLCQKESCRHCGVILHCEQCNMSYCEGCIENDVRVNCKNVQAKKERIQKYK